MIQNVTCRYVQLEGLHAFSRQYPLLALEELSFNIHIGATLQTQSQSQGIKTSSSSSSTSAGTSSDCTGTSTSTSDDSSTPLSLSEVKGALKLGAISVYLDLNGNGRSDVGASAVLSDVLHEIERERERDDGETEIEVDSDSDLIRLCEELEAVDRGEYAPHTPHVRANAHAGATSATSDRNNDINRDNDASSGGNNRDLTTAQARAREEGKGEGEGEEWSDALSDFGNIHAIVPTRKLNWELDVRLRAIQVVCRNEVSIIDTADSRYSVNTVNTVNSVSSGVGAADTIDSNRKKSTDSLSASATTGVLEVLDVVVRSVGENGIMSNSLTVADVVQRVERAGDAVADSDSDSINIKNNRSGTITRSKSRSRSRSKSKSKDEEETEGGDSIRGRVGGLGHRTTVSASFIDITYTDEYSMVPLSSFGSPPRKGVCSLIIEVQPRCMHLSCDLIPLLSHEIKGVSDSLRLKKLQDSVRNVKDRDRKRERKVVRRVFNSTTPISVFGDVSGDGGDDGYSPSPTAPVPAQRENENKRKSNASYTSYIYYIKGLFHKSVQATVNVGLLQVVLHSSSSLISNSNSNSSGSSSSSVRSSSSTSAADDDDDDDIDVDVRVSSNTNTNDTNDGTSNGVGAAGARNPRNPRNPENSEKNSATNAIDNIDSIKLSLGPITIESIEKEVDVEVAGGDSFQNSVQICRSNIHIDIDRIWFQRTNKYGMAVAGDAMIDIKQVFFDIGLPVLQQKQQQRHWKKADFLNLKRTATAGEKHLTGDFETISMNFWYKQINKNKYKILILRIYKWFNI